MHMQQPSNHGHFRLARPVTDLPRTERMYCEGLGLLVLDRFEDHEGFDGVMLGHPGSQFHFEFTHCRSHPVAPAPTVEDLTVFYIPCAIEWKIACERMTLAGFAAVPSSNPFWEVQGRTFQDRDGYRTVLQNASWSIDRGADR